MTVNDDFLNKLRKEPRPEFAAALYQRINRPMQIQSKYRAMRFAALTLSVLVVLTAALLLSPSARAFAQEIVQQVGGYIFVLGGQPIEVQGAPGPIAVWKTLDAVSIEAEGDVPTENDPSEASSLAGFAVLAPSYLPDGYTAMSGWFVILEENGRVVTNAYRDTTNHFFIINQWKAGEGASRTFAKDQIVDVTVRDQSGVWLPDKTGGPGQKNALVWEENGITFSIITDSLPLDELLKVAESLSQ
jgi:Domain of unknown function (DUF4367)